MTVNARIRGFRVRLMAEFKNKAVAASWARVLGGNTGEIGSASGPVLPFSPVPNPNPNLGSLTAFSSLSSIFKTIHYLKHVVV